ncbi:MAG TPA: hypothetical protein PLM53_16875 [Spirochaetota bacterium]|nr:hypothetical protein [Spirochaetota bacterium]HPC39860.1 hypothetical protein [Spirochaetota bacterium]HQF08964.1 hypothetical protein [Spirochaetota bacterium]HQH98772.1 hypothetical protein [Spirochaetota bacterium]HQJ72247.1 hypothetical protein [Spirochaetota bacterium]
MNHNPEHFTALTGKYRLSHPVSMDDQRYILDSTRPSLTALLKRKGVYGTALGAVILLLGISRRAGVSLTMVQAKIAAGLTATVLAAASVAATVTATGYIMKRIDDSKKSGSEKKDIPVPDLKTDDQIRQHYNKLEEVHLDDGTRLVGAVIFQDRTTIKVHTIHGVVQLPVTSVQSITVR